MSDFDKKMLRLNIPKKYRSKYTYEHSHGNEYHSQVWKKYDKFGNLINMATSTGLQVWCTYDELGQLLTYRDNTGVERRYSNGELIYLKTKYGLEVTYEYDSNGNLIGVKDSEGYSKTITSSDLAAIQYQLEQGNGCINPYCISRGDGSCEQHFSQEESSTQNSYQNPELCRTYTWEDCRD
jgi:YD repeat-containing protein